MERIEVGINEDVMDIVKRIRESQFAETVLCVPEKAVLFENSLNLKLLKKEAGKVGKNLTFETDDEVGRNLIEYMEGGVVGRIDDETGFMTSGRVAPVTSLIHEDAEKFAKPRRSLSLPKFSFPGVKKAGIAILILSSVSLGALAYFLLWYYPRATVGLTVSSQPLVKSVTVKLSSKIVSADAENRLLPGSVATASASTSVEGETTGEKIIGEKAEGKVTIVNKTDDDTKFKKGTEISLISSKESLKFVLNEDATVPKKTVTPGPDPLVDPEVTTFGEKDVNVTAVDIGSKYNLDDDRNFKVDDKDTDDFVASNDDKFSGGTSKTVKAVSQADKDALSKQAFESVRDGVISALKADLSNGTKLVDSSVTYVKSAESFDKNVGDEAQTLKVTQSVLGSGLAYSSKELGSLLEELLTQFVPEGFELSEKDKEIEVGVLETPAVAGKIEEIDLEVKIRAFVLPKVDENEIVKNLKGAKIEDGKKYLSGIKNIKSYEIDMWPKLTFLLGRFPPKEERIEVNLIRE